MSIKTRGGKRPNAGRPPLSHRRKPRNHTTEIHELIPIDRSVTAAELKKMAKERGIASDTLYRKLKMLEGTGIIFRGVDTSEKTPRVFYARQDFCKFGSMPTTAEEKEEYVRFKNIAKNFQAYLWTLPIWESILAECEKQEPGKLKELLARVRSENIDSLRTYLNMVDQATCQIMEYATGAEDEGKARDIIRVASNVFIRYGMEGFITSPFFAASNRELWPELWREAGKPFAITLEKTLTEERVSALQRLVGEATNAIARSDKRKCIAKRYIIDLSKRILKERGELEGTEDLKTLVRKLGIKLKGGV